MADPAFDQTQSQPEDQESSPISVRFATTSQDPGANATDQTQGPALKPSRHSEDLGQLGRYRVVRRLGKGGMGIVYLGFDETLHRHVALKVLQGGSSSSRQRFLREARAAARIRSEHVVTIHDVDEDAGIPFIAMEYLEGTPLNVFLGENPIVPISVATRIAKELTAGLVAAHAVGLVHRDIKPANIWLETKAPGGAHIPEAAVVPEDATLVAGVSQSWVGPSRLEFGRVKLLDFGLAKSDDDKTVGLTGDGVVVGTPAFMSPEQGRGEEVDVRTDLFSLGAVIYQLCTGRLPFEGTTVMAILTALATQEPPPVTSLNPQVPPALASLIHRLLAKNPADRPPSAAVVAEELLAMTEGRAQPAPHVVYVPVTAVAAPVENSHDPSQFEGLEEQQVETAPKPIPRSGGLWLAAGGAILLATGITFGVINSLSKPKPVEEPIPDARPTSKPIPPKPLKATPSGPGLRFAPGQYVESPGIGIPAEEPFTLEGFVTLDEAFKGEGHLFGTKFRTRAVVVDRDVMTLWEAHAIINGRSLGGDQVPVTRGKRTHIALVRDRTNMRFYVDGKSAGSWVADGSLPASDRPITIGGDAFTGIIDEVRVSGVGRYNKDFIPARLELDGDTLALYRFDEGQGEELKDSSGFDKHARIIGAKWLPPANPPVRRE